MSDWFQTYTGKQFHPMDPTVDEIDICDIARGLSMIARFNGHTLFHYSVAQHSLLVSENVPNAVRLEALLHDASEAYLGDMVRPLKRSMPEYRAAEDRLERVIAERFGLIYPWPAEVKEADNRALMTERRDCLPSHPGLASLWSQKATCFSDVILPQTIVEMERDFLWRFAALYSERMKVHIEDIIGAIGIAPAAAPRPIR